MLHNFASECWSACGDGLSGRHPELTHKLIHSFCGLIVVARVMHEFITLIARVERLAPCGLQCRALTDLAGSGLRR
jgi:hypothetical protein